MKQRVLSVLILVLLAGSFAGQPWQSARATATETPSTQQSAQVATATMGAPTRVVVPMTDKPPVRSAADLQRLQALQSRVNLPGPALPVGTTAVQRADSVVDPASASHTGTAVQAEPQGGVNAPGTMWTFRDTFIPHASLANSTSIVGEPSAANNGYVVFETGNWYAAVSSNGGQSFQYINPAAAFPNDYGGFCCDQVVVYDPSRDIFIWELLYLPDATHGALRIAVSRGTDAVQGIWYYYDLVADNTFWYDFPDLTLNDDNLFITTNRFVIGGGWDSAYIFRWPLDPLLAGSGFGYGYVNRNDNFAFRAVRGAMDTIYWASHNSTSQVRIFNWTDESGTYFWNDVNLSAAWNDAARVCPGPDGLDWCGRSDGRILAGWVARGVVGFMWSASQGGGFTWPYIEAVTVNQSDMSYLGRPLVWTSADAFIYPAATVNARGDVGIVFNYGGGADYPSVAYAVYDDYTTPPPGWVFYGAGTSTQGPNANAWGDYLAVTPFAPTGLVWAGTGFVLNGCGNDGCVDPMYYIFGRERDMRSLQRYWAPRYGIFTPLLAKNAAP